MPKLYDLAHCRAGDKGNTSILSLIAYRPDDYRASGRASDRRCRRASPARHRARRRCAATSLPQLSALQFVCEHSLNGGVTTSLALDAHGKSLSFALLEMEI